MIQSTAVENALNAAEIVRRARDLAITTSIALGIVPVLYIANLVLVRGNGAVLVSGHSFEMALLFIIALILMWRLIATAVFLNRQLQDQRFLLESGPVGSAHIYFLRCVLGLGR